MKYLSLIKCSSGSKKMIESFILSLPILFFTGLLDHPLSSPQTALVVIPFLAFWDKYTESLHIWNQVAEIRSKFLFINAYPAEYQVLAYIRAKIEENKTKSNKHKKTGL
jgi:hypothetical protein